MFARSSSGDNYNEGTIVDGDHKLSRTVSVSEIKIKDALKTL